MKKSLSILLCLIMILCVFSIVPLRASAEDVNVSDTGAGLTIAEEGVNTDIESAGATSLPNSVFIAQAQNNTCTLAAATNMIRARTYLSGNTTWSSITEASVKPVAWTDNGGLWYNFTYWFSGNSVTVSHTEVPGLTVSSLKALLNSHPEGIELYCREVPHAVLVTDYDGDTFYCADSNPNSAGVRRTLDSSLLGYYLGSQANIISKADDYWYISSYSIVSNITPKPSNPWIKASKTSIPTGGSISFTFGADNATGYTIGIDKNGSRIITEGVSSGKSYTFNEEGNYSAYVTCYNSTGFVDSSRVNFSVFAPIILGNDFVAYITNSKGGINVGTNSVGNVELQTKSNSDHQKWQFIRQSDNSYKIINIGYNQCLDVANFGTANGTNIGMCPSNDSNAQRYYIRDAGSGYGIVPKVNTDAAIDISGGSLTNGTNIQEYTWNGSNAQVFSIDYVGLKPKIYRDYNGHTYEFYDIQVPWNQAYRFCESKGGHLVTISDDAENFAVYELCGGSVGVVWIGATDFNREGNWYWITGEPLSYNAWYLGEPNNTGSAENYGMMYIDAGTLGDSSTVGTIRKWNDTKLSFAPNVSYTVGFVCEYDNGDGNADSYTPVATETIDGITYSIFDYCVDWQTAEEICEAKGGQLVKIDSAEKNNTVVQLMEKGRKSEYWINATDRFSEGTWTDSEGNALSYSNWVDGNPDNDFNAEQFVMISKGTGKWGDLKGFSPYYRGTGFICESRVPTGITLNKEELSLMIGDTSTLKATVTPTGVDDTVTWKSSNTKVATVTKSGKITGKSEGYSFVTATTVNGLEATCIVLVGGSKNYMLGDSDEDGEVTIIDATCIQRHLANIPTATYNETAADADEDDEVTIIDATSIQRKLAELPHNNNIGKSFFGGTLPKLSEWTDWSTTVPTESNIVMSENRTEYRYKDRKEFRASSQPATPEGYKLIFSDYCGQYSDWSAWSGWNTSRQSADGTLKQEGTTTGYRYYAFVCPNCGNRDPYNIPGNDNCSKCGYGGALNWNEMYYEKIGANAPSSTSYDSNKGYATINGQRWYFEKPGKDNGAGGTGQPTTTLYRYRTRSELIYYLFEQIDFCNWQTDAVTASDTRTVETRTVYRYRYIIM